jgi:hypothetical protein
MHTHTFICTCTAFILQGSARQTRPKRKHYRCIRVQGAAGPQFTCFTSTKVQILTQKAQQVLNFTRFYLLYQSKISNFDAAGAAAANFTRFTSTKVQILTQNAQQHIDIDALRRKKANKKQKRALY